MFEPMPLSQLLDEAYRACGLDPDNESLYSFASSNESNCTRPELKVEPVLQDDQDSIPPAFDLPSISAVREIRAYERSRRQVRDAAKYASVHRRRGQYVAGLDVGRSPQGGRLQRDRKGDWGVKRVRDRSSTTSLLQNAVEVLQDDWLTVLEESALCACEDDVVVGTRPSQNTCDRVLTACPGHETVIPYDRNSVYHDSYPTILEFKAAEPDALVVPPTTTNCDPDDDSYTNALTINSLIQSISVTREVRSYECNRLRTKTAAKLARAHEQRRGLFNRSVKYRTRSPISRKPPRRLRVLVDLKDEFGFVDDLHCGEDDDDDDDTIPIEVSLSAISPEEPSGRPFYFSDLSYSTRKFSKRKELGFEFVPQVSAVIALDDEHIEEDEPWEHVWNDDLLDEPLFSPLDSC